MSSAERARADRADQPLSTRDTESTASSPAANSRGSGVNAGVPRGPGGSPSTAQALYIFPHAGGTAGSYAAFARAFSMDIKRVAVQYPGRTGQHDVPDIASIPALADDIYKMLAPTNPPDAGIVFFGHSMGGLVAFEVARKFESMGRPIAALFISASPAPGHSGYQHLQQSSDDDLLKMVTEMTGANAEFLGEQFGATILRTLRNYGAITDYSCPPGTTVSCPIYAYAAASDTLINYDSVAAWSEFTTSEFAVSVVAGGHFYVTEDARELVENIELRIARVQHGA
jgi:surfactin synthase thioesterase subunit